MNRVVTWKSHGIEYEADQRHADIIIESLGLKGKKSLASPGVRTADEKDDPEDEERLSPTEASIYRSVTARANYLSQDRLDIKYPVKELSRWQCQPRRKDARRLTRLGKYLIGRERYVTNYPYQSRVRQLEVWTDTDYAGCRDTRKSTSGGLIRFGQHLIRGWSSTQKVIALSSGEAEYYGLVRGTAEAMGTKSILTDMGVTVSIRAFEDSVAARGIATRTGLGKVRHMEVNQLWV